MQDQLSIEAAAEAMKAAAQEAAAQRKSTKADKGKVVAVESTAADPKQRRTRTRVARAARESAPVVAIRRAIADHEREIKRLCRALKAIGG